MRSNNILIMAIVIIFAFISFSNISASEEKKGVSCPHFSSFYCNSLHFTGNGMRYWYERKDGFMQLTGIPYNNLSCKKCHVTSCDKCHMIKKEGKKFFSINKTRDINTCLKCHARTRLVLFLDRKTSSGDVHLFSGMSCSDCHPASDVHGTGISYDSMSQIGVVSANCMNCHKKGESAPVFNNKLKAHRIHKGRLDCSACHVSASISCYNCHFGEVIKTRKEKGNFFPMKSWLLLINYNGKVYAGNVMSLVYKRKKFIAYAPYFTHSVVSKGRNCSDCHSNPAIKLIKEGKNVPVVTYKDGKIIAWKGVVPCVPDKLSWVFLDKKGNKWIPINEGKEVVQFAAYGSPLTKKQLKRLMMHFSK